MKKEFIKFRCSIYEKKRLKIRAKRSGLSLSEFCRRSAFESKIIERLSEEHIQLYKLLIRYHNNFKSISNMYKKRDPRLSMEVESLANQIKRHINAFDV